MRIALIADIHGNFVALERVLQDLQEEKPDQIICLGDVAALGRVATFVSRFDYLRSFRPTIEITLDKETQLLCFHGSPKSD